MTLRVDFCRIRSGLMSLLLLTAFAATAADGAFPVTIKHQWGETVIRKQPVRVVALGWSDADTVLALGVTPVAIQDWQQLNLKDGQVNPWTQQLVKSAAPVVLPRSDLDFRKIAALHPDLILVVNGRDNSSRANYDLLSCIAPRVASPPDVVNNNIPWQEQVRMDAKALGKVAAGEQLIADTDKSFEAVRKAHPEFAGKTFTINWGVRNGWHSYTGGDIRPQILENIGLNISPTVKDLPANNYFVNLSMEQTDKLEADLVMLVAFARPASAILAEPAVQNLPAFRQHRTLLLDNQHDATLRAAFATGSTPGIDYALDRLTPRISAALAGQHD